MIIIYMSIKIFLLLEIRTCIVASGLAPNRLHISQCYILGFLTVKLLFYYILYEVLWQAEPNCNKPLDCSWWMAGQPSFLFIGWVLLEDNTILYYILFL